MQLPYDHKHDGPSKINQIQLYKKGIVLSWHEIDHLLISTFHSKIYRSYFPLQKGVQSGPLSWKVQPQRYNWNIVESGVKHHKPNQTKPLMFFYHGDVIIINGIQKTYGKFFMTTIYRCHGNWTCHIEYCFHLSISIQKKISAI
jgi:hypothetical protein